MLVCIQSIYRFSIEHSDRSETRLQAWQTKKHTNKTLQSPRHSVDTLLKWSDCVLIMSNCRSRINGHPQRNIYNWMHCKSLSRVTVSLLPHTSLLSLSHYVQLQKKSNNKEFVFFIFYLRCQPSSLS